MITARDVFVFVQCCSDQVELLQLKQKK